MKKLSFLLLILLCDFAQLNAQNLLTDLRPGLDGSEPGLDNAFQKNNELYFAASPDAITRYLYKTDGTSGNTVVLEGGSNLFVSMILGFLGDELFYIAGDVMNGGHLALYKTDGTPGGGELVSDYHQANDWLIAYPMTIVMDDVLYFIGNDGVNGFELFRTDGTNAGTYLVKDINPGIESILLLTTPSQYFAELDGYIYFGAADPVHGAELWRSNGTEAGTELVADIDPTTPTIPNQGSNPAYLYTHNNAVYFSAFRPVDGRELWKTDGTPAGTVLVKDIAAGDGNPGNFVSYNGSLYFTAYYPNQDFTLYKTDGTANGTFALRQPNSGGPAMLTDKPPVLFKGKLFFNASGQSGERSVWYSDGTSLGTVALPGGPSPFNSNAENLLATSNYLYFTATNDVNFGVYRTSGLANQTSLLTDADFNANTSHALFLVNQCLLVRGDKGGATGEEVYKVCGQNTQTVGVEETVLMDLAVFPNPCVGQLFLTASSDLTEISELSLQSLSGQFTELAFLLSDQNTLVVNGLSELSTGIYILSVRIKNGETRQMKLCIE